MIALPAGRVVIVGAGPAGLTLACELALAGVPCRVYERRARPLESGVVGLAPHTLELLDLRGLADPIVAVGKRISRIRLGSGRGVELTGLASRFPHLTVICRSAAEQVLAARAAELGVEVIYGAEVVGLGQDESGVTVELRAPHRQWRERAVYLVGCDGAESTVRLLAGMAYEGDTYDFAAVQADVRLGRPPAEEMVMMAGGAGVMLAIGYGGGRHRVTCMGAGARPSSPPPTLDELRTLLCRIVGHDLDPQAPRWLGRHRLASCLVNRYRSGRVLVAGDAAHQHSPVGGQGINLGIGDAVNLGWKLAAVVRGWAPPGLLDTYEAERRPVARQVLDISDEATRLLTAAPVPDRADPDRLISRLVGLPAGAADRDAPGGEAPGRYASGAGQPGTALPVAPADDGPLTGRQLPELALTQLDGRVVRPSELLRAGRFVLLDVSRDARCAMVAKGWPDRVDPVVVDAAEPAGLGGALAVLIRPDGYVAWSTGARTPDVRARRCRDALSTWCGSGRSLRLGTSGRTLAGSR